MKSANIKEIKMGFRCNQQWSDMTGNEVSRHCELCQKAVMNFSDFTNKQVIDFMSNSKNQNVCAKLSQAQLNSINCELQEVHKTPVLKSLALATTVSTMLACGTSNKITEPEEQHFENQLEIISKLNNPDTSKVILIEGLILDENSEPLIGANFILQNTHIGFITDIDGSFHIEIPKNEADHDLVLIEYLGYKTLEIPLTEIQNKSIKVELKQSEVLLGEMVIVRPPLHKRIWNKITRFFL